MTTVAIGPRRRAKVRREPATIRPGEVAEAVSLASTTFAMVAIVCLWFVLQVLVLSGISQERDQHLLYGRFRQELAAATAPTGPVVPAGDPVAVISVPQLRLSQVVVEGTAAGDLLAGPGHRRDTVLPGQQGVSLVYGRANTYGAPFHRLMSVQRGDQIVVLTGQGRTVYVVDGVRRAGDRLPAPPTGEQARLTLVSAEGTGPLAALGARNAVYVDATAAQGQPFPGSRPTAIPDSERAMAVDSGALPMLVLALALLVALALGVSAARHRWSAALVWVVASPVAIALAWFTTDVVMRLLPNLM